MQTFCAAVDTMKKSCKEYEQSLKKTLTDNATLKGKVDNMAKALDDMKHLFSTDGKYAVPDPSIPPFSAGIRCVLRALTGHYVRSGARTAERLSQRR